MSDNNPGPGGTFIRDFKQQLLRLQPLEIRRIVTEQLLFPVCVPGQLFVTARPGDIDVVWKGQEPVVLEGVQFIDINGNSTSADVLIPRPVLLEDHHFSHEKYIVSKVDGDSEQYANKVEINLDYKRALPVISSHTLTQTTNYLVEVHPRKYLSYADSQRLTVAAGYALIKRVAALSPHIIAGRNLPFFFVNLNSLYQVGNVSRVDPWDILPEEATQADFDNPSTLTDIGLQDVVNEGGAGVTVVIFDSAPDMDNWFKTRNNTASDGPIINYFIQQDPASLNKIAAALPPSEPELDYPSAVKMTAVKEIDPLVKPPAAGAPAVTGSTLTHSEVLPYHGILIASLVRKVAPEAKIVLFEVCNQEGLTDQSHLDKALQLVQLIRTSEPVREDLHAIGWDFDPNRLVLNLSLGVLDSLAEDVKDWSLFDSCQAVCACEPTTVEDKHPEIGAVIVAAAGNDSYYLHPHNPVEPAAYGYFCDDRDLYEKVIAVSSSSNPAAPEYTIYSNQGNLTAPGDYLVMDAGVQITSSINSRYVKWAGTSFSTGLVSGAAALLLGGYGDFDEITKPGTVKERLWKGAMSKVKSWRNVPVINLA